MSEVVRRPSVEDKAREGRPLSGLSVKLDLIAEADFLKQDRSWSHNGHSAKTLLKYSDFRAVLITIQARTRMSKHHTNHRVTLQVLDGCVRLHLPCEVVELSRGQLLAIDRAIPHDLEAVENSVVLLTLVWSKPPAAGDLGR